MAVDEEIVREASCSCGQLGAICRGEPALVSLCHCRACQRRTGGPFGVAAFFTQERVRTRGESTTFRRTADNGHAITFHFCPTCGSTVYWEPERKQGMVAVAVGSFADPSFPAPTQAVWHESRHSWVADPG